MITHGRDYRHRSSSPLFVNIPNGTPSPMSLKKKNQVVVDLLRDGADREAEDVNGYRALHYATMWGHPATTKALLKSGAGLESITRVDGTRPLHIAARYGSACVVQELLSQGDYREWKRHVVC